MNRIKLFLPQNFFLLAILIIGLIASSISSANPPISHLLKQAQKQLQTKEWKRAAEIFQSVLREDPKNSYAHANLGVALSRMDDHKKALLAYEKALQLGYDSHMFRFNRGLSFARLNLLEEAKQ